jgi:hypothetical protein
MKVSGMPPWPTPSWIASFTMPIACSSAATVCASKRRRKPSLLDRVQSLMERSHPSSGRSATPADINQNGRPTSIGMPGRHHRNPHRPKAYGTRNAGAGQGRLGLTA